MAQAWQLHEVQHLVHTFGPRFFGNFLDHQAVGDVLIHGHVRKEGIVLKDRVDGALIGRQVRNVLPVKKDAARGRSIESSHHAKAGGLA